MMQTQINTALPTTLAEFQVWEPADGYKYEWNDGELIRFAGMKRKHLRLMRVLNLLFDTTRAKRAGGQLVHEHDVQLTGIQLRRPDLAYFSGSQIDSSDDDNGPEPIPAFAIEVISCFDQINIVKAKLREYFNNGVQVVWLIFPDEQSVEVYTSFKTVQICTDNDLCSARPVLDDFALTVNQLFEISSDQ